MVSNAKEPQIRADDIVFSGIFSYQNLQQVLVAATAKLSGESIKTRNNIFRAIFVFYITFSLSQVSRYNLGKMNKLLSRGQNGIPTRRVGTRQNSSLIFLSFVSYIIIDG